MPPCAECGKPVHLPRKIFQAWEAWAELDAYARPVDGFGGFPLPLNLADIDRICARYDDPEGIRWRVLMLEEKALTFRRAEYHRKHPKK